MDRHDRSSGSGLEVVREIRSDGHIIFTASGRNLTV